MPSSVIHDFIYDAPNRRLTVRFVCGRVCAYDGVPQDTADGLASASSQDSYFSAAVRDRFATVRIRRGG